MHSSCESRCYSYLLLMCSICVLSSALQTIQCSGSNNEKCDSITCEEDDDCVITCDTLVCNSTSIYCPLNGDCTVICEGRGACSGSVIYGNASNGNFELICDNDSCENIQVFGSTLSSNTGNDFNVICGNGTCNTSQIYCAHATNCQITCNGTSTSCEHMTVYGPLSHELTLECFGTMACNNAFISAYHSSNVFIEGCAYPWTHSCVDLTIYCPIATDSKHCYIQSINGIQIYAVFGWDDINIDYSETYGLLSATMHCGSDYSIVCDTQSNVWRCVDQICEQTTIAPSLYPLITDGEYITMPKNSVIVTVITQNIMVILITLCSILGFFICLSACLAFMYCTKDQNKVTQTQVVVVHSNGASNSNNTVITNTSATSQVSEIRETVDESIPGTVNSDDVVLASPLSAIHMTLTPRMSLEVNHNRYRHNKGKWTPSSYVSNVSDINILESACNDEEVIASSEDEYDAHEYKTQTGYECEPRLEKLQSEGGEQYHKHKHIEILEAPSCNAYMMNHVGEMDVLEMNEGSINIEDGTMMSAGEDDLVQIQINESANGDYIINNETQK